MTMPRIMGILNVTPDSFSGDGVMRGGDYVSAALALAERMIFDGADMLDIGGESSRPGAEAISATQEIDRVVPVVSEIHNRWAEIVISVDTVKAEVAARALAAGATMVNDISALARDDDMARVVANNNAHVVLMHNRALGGAYRTAPVIGGQYDAPEYSNILADVVSALKERVDFALRAGIARDKIVLDPGIGFGKTPDQNLALIARLGRVKEMGFPVLMALSRKSFIGHVLDLPVEDRLEGTAAAIAVSVMQGADMVRVHDVRFMARVAKMAAAIREVAV